MPGFWAMLLSFLGALTNKTGDTLDFLPIKYEWSTEIFDL